MAVNTKIFSETSGRMRLISVIFAVIAFILLEGNYLRYNNEESFYYALLVCMVISIIMCIVSIIGLLDNGNIRMLDNILHAVMSLAIIITSILFLISVFDYRRTSTNSFFARRLAAGVLGFIYGLILANMGWLLFRS